MSFGCKKWYVLGTEDPEFVGYQPSPHCLFGKCGLDLRQGCRVLRVQFGHSGRPWINHTLPSLLLGQVCTSYGPVSTRKGPIPFLFCVQRYHMFHRWPWQEYLREINTFHNILINFLKLYKSKSTIWQLNTLLWFQGLPPTASNTGLITRWGNGEGIVGMEVTDRGEQRDLNA